MVTDQEAKLSFLIENEALAAILNFRVLLNSFLAYLSPMPTFVPNIKIIRHQHLQLVERGQERSTDAAER
jgi:hypothetical protein